MITIHLKPSFHNFSTVTIGELNITYEVLPRLRDLKGLNKKEKLSPSEYLELKTIKAFNVEAEKTRYKAENVLPNAVLNHKSQVADLINQIISAPQNDKRIILDGIQIECVLSQADEAHKTISFRSPKYQSREFKIIQNLFAILDACFDEEPIINHIELMQGYFGIGHPWKITSENPMTLRLFGSLTSHEKEDITQLFNTLKPDGYLVLDIRNLDGMGTTFHECFKVLMDKMKAVYWLVRDQDNVLLERHLSEMNVKGDFIFTDKTEIIAKIFKDKG